MPFCKLHSRLRAPSRLRAHFSPGTNGYIERTPPCQSQPPDGRGGPRQRTDSRHMFRTCTITFVLFPQSFALQRLTSQPQASGAEHCIAMCSNASLGQHQPHECEGKLASTRVREAGTERGTRRGKPGRSVAQYAGTKLRSHWLQVDDPARS